MSNINLHTVSQENDYQSNLLQLLFNPLLNDSTNTLPFKNLGNFSIKDSLDVYQNNGAANAVNALKLLYPSVKILLGDLDFYMVAKAFWLEHPPSKGDWSYYQTQNGYSFGNWIRQKDYGDLDTNLPFLADLADLDDALNNVQDASNSSLDSHSLKLLVQDPSTLNIIFQPSMKVLNLSYDIMNLRKKLIKFNSSSGLIFSKKFPKKLTHSILIYRIRWKSHAKKISVADKQCIFACLNGTTLNQAYQVACQVDSQFDFSKWIADLLHTHCILRVIKNQNFNLNII
jgi:hypothetical protein